MKKIVTLFTVLSILGLGIFGLVKQGGDIGANDMDLSGGISDFIVNSTKISGDSIITGYCTAISFQGRNYLKSRKKGSGGRNVELAAVSQDCWTVDKDNMALGQIEGEWYWFSRTDEGVWFVDKVKVPKEGLPNGFALDHFIFKCKPITRRPFETIAPPILWMDDIYFGQIDAPGYPEEILFYWFIPVEYILDVFGANVELDWAVGKEYQADLLPDSDGDGFPDVFLEITPGQPPGYALFWKEPDECGANFINFFLGNSFRNLVVQAPFETVPALPPRPPLPGMVWGEDSQTRPWCFWFSE